jgi:hypothetical protein
MACWRFTRGEASRQGLDQSRSVQGGPEGEKFRQPLSCGIVEPWLLPSDSRPVRPSSRRPCCSGGDRQPRPRPRCRSSPWPRPTCSRRRPPRRDLSATSGRTPRRGRQGSPAQAGGQAAVAGRRRPGAAGAGHRRQRPGRDRRRSGAGRDPGPGPDRPGRGQGRRRRAGPRAGRGGSAQLSLAAAEAALITGADDKACKIGEALSVDRGAPYWLRLRAFCQALADQHDAAQLTFTWPPSRPRTPTTPG